MPLAMDVGGRAVWWRGIPERTKGLAKAEQG